MFKVPTFYFCDTSSSGYFGNISNFLFVRSLAPDAHFPTLLFAYWCIDTINFRENNLCGTVPQEICDLKTSGFLEDLQADCRNSKVECDCCTKCVKQKTPFCGAETA
uniref:Uncharacterized protein n=1 Tax=Ditylum brightwellii TaxID=49249 RepID=A0A7S4T9Z5_9STRA